jgi:hypothetical protein
MHPSYNLDLLNAMFYLLLIFSCIIIRRCWILFLQLMEQSHEVKLTDRLGNTETSTAPNVHELKEVLSPGVLEHFCEKTLVLIFDANFSNSSTQRPESQSATIQGSPNGTISTALMLVCVTISLEFSYPVSFFEVTSTMANTVPCTFVYHTIDGCESPPTPTQNN